MIQLFNINKHNIDTSEFSNLLHDDCVEEFEKKIAQYVGAKYACSVNSATSAIFLIMKEKRTYVREKVTINIPSMIPPVVANAALTSGFFHKLNFVDDVDWVGDSYVLHQFKDFKVVDSAQKLQEGQFRKECNPEDLMIFSFYPTKPLGGSDGGMIVTDDYEKYKWYKEAVLNGMSYAENNWDRGISFPGYKMYMSSIQAQICLNNFKQFEEKMSRLNNLVDIYNKELGYNNTSSHLFRIEVTDNNKFINKMKKDNIICGIHYSALHSNSVYNRGMKFDCPKSELLEKRTVSLPMNETLSTKDINHIVESVRKNI